MQVYQRTNIEMKRDMDLVRDLLLGIEADRAFDGLHWIEPNEKSHNLGVLGIEQYSKEDIAYHLTMLVEEGFVNGKTTMEMPIISKLTWKGHELVDDIHDAEVWSKTKERMKGLTSIGISFMWEIAKAEIRTRLKLPLP